MTNIITNPVVIALIAGVITYLYLMWTAPTVKKRLQKGGKKELVKLKPSMAYPLIITVATWLTVYCYQEYYLQKKGNNAPKIQPDTKYTLKRGSESSNNRSYRMMRPGVGIPVSANCENFPDVFINTID